MLRGLLVLIFCVGFASFLEANVKLGELTKSNMSFKKSYKTATFEGNDNAHRDSDKRFDKDSYSGQDKSFYDADKRFGTNSYYDADKRNSSFGDKYVSPEQDFINSKSRFYDSNKELFFNNKDRDLTRDYSGRSDFSVKRNVYEESNNTYEDLMDKSMSDINKYHSQTAREDSRDGGLPVAPANAKESESSILDLLDFSTKNIDNSSVKFTLPRSMSNMGVMPKNDAPYVQEEPYAPRENTQVRASANPVLQNHLKPQRDYGQVANQNTQRQNKAVQWQSAQNLNPAMQDMAMRQEAERKLAMQNAAMRNQSNPNMNQSQNQSQKKTYIINKTLGDADAPTSIFGVPKELNSGKVQISVEVKPK